MYPEIIVEGVRSIRAGSLIARADLRIGFLHVIGAKLLDHDGRRILAMPRSSDRRAVVRITDASLRDRARQAVESALAAIETAANAGGDDGR